jgi:NAD(P)-dependent dehydrogenase (short-subunit alcohol dehydrogenase family)
MIDFDGRVILVTGGSRGIGAAAVRALTGAGAQAIVHYASNRAAADAVVGEVGADRAVAIGADLVSPEATERLWDEAVAWRGHVDVLVNNAGIYEHADPDGDLAAWQIAWQRVLQVNLVAPAQLCRRAVAHFRTRRGGIVVNVASRAAFRGEPHDAMNYAGSKGGLIALTRSLARAHAHEGILAYGVAPGFTATEMAASGGDLTEVVRQIPMGGLAPPEDVANVIAFLASGLAPHATGTTVDVNGASYVR